MFESGAIIFDEARESDRIERLHIKRVSDETAFCHYKHGAGGYRDAFLWLQAGDFGIHHQEGYD